jgi:SAM-dependent methyltransferase
MEEQQKSGLQTSYDRVAEGYARRIYDELKDKPIDRQLLDELAQSLSGRGVICDLGCGPGQVARYLHDHGAQVVGVDLSAGQVDHARRLNPDIDFFQGDMLALDFPDEAWAGIAAFYSIIHIPRQKVVDALLEIKRVLQPGGLLLMAFHIGDETIHLDEWWEQPVNVDFHFFQDEEMTTYLKTAGFEVIKSFTREPYSEVVEHQSQRAYILARKPCAV